VRQRLRQLLGALDLFLEQAAVGQREDVEHAARLPQRRIVARARQRAAS
jgi:hypothetical protein